MNAQMKLGLCSIALADTIVAPRRAVKPVKATPVAMPVADILAQVRAYTNAQMRDNARTTWNML